VLKNRKLHAWETAGIAIYHTNGSRQVEIVERIVEERKSEG
jgi:hypothetical protein